MRKAVRKELDDLGRDLQVDLKVVIPPAPGLAVVSCVKRPGVVAVASHIVQAPLRSSAHSVLGYSSHRKILIDKYNIHIFALIQPGIRVQCVNFVFR